MKLIFKKRSELIEGDKEVESKASNDQDDYDDDDDDDDDDDEATESGFFIILMYVTKRVRMYVLVIMCVRMFVCNYVCIVSIWYQLLFYSLVYTERA